MPRSGHSSWKRTLVFTHKEAEPQGLCQGKLGDRTRSMAASPPPTHTTLLLTPGWPSGETPGFLSFHTISLEDRPGQRVPKLRMGIGVRLDLGPCFWLELGC